MMASNQSKASCDLMAPAMPNTSLKFSKISGEGDFHLMVSKDQEDIYMKMRSENSELKDALKMLQKELLEIVALKHDVFVRRFKAEFGSNKEPTAETEEALTA
jgi:hypothetical protein